jgi:hypothetical protein
MLLELDLLCVSFPLILQRFIPTQLPIQLVQWALSPGLKRPGREADHSPPASAKIKKMWIYTFTPPYAFMA